MALLAAAIAAPTVSAASPRGSATVTLRILPGALHGVDSFAPASNFAIAPGVRVTVKIVNYTSEWHMFTVPALKVSALIKPRLGATPRVTWVRFTARSFGVFDWYCVLCRDGVHRGAHEMGGKVYAIIGEPAP